MEEPEEREISWHSNDGCESCDEIRCKEVWIVWNIPIRSNLQELIRHGKKQLPLNPCIAGNLNSSFFLTWISAVIRYRYVRPPAPGQGSISVPSFHCVISSNWHKFQVWRHASESGQIPRPRLSDGQAPCDPDEGLDLETPSGKIYIVFVDI